MEDLPTASVQWLFVHYTPPVPFLCWLEKRKRQHREAVARIAHERCAGGSWRRLPFLGQEPSRLLSTLHLGMVCPILTDSFTPRLENTDMLRLID